MTKFSLDQTIFMTIIGYNKVMNVPIHEVKAKFSAYLSLVEQGNHVTILRHDKPVAELRPIVPIMPKPRVAGSAKGQISYASGAFDPMSEEELNEIDQQPLFPTDEPH